jgi:intein/homing endonuclease
MSQAAPKNLISSFLADLRCSITMAAETKQLPTILDFIDNYVDLGISFSPQQRLLFKLVKNLPLTDVEYDICEYWQKVGRLHCDLSHVGPRQEICIESGRRSGKCVPLSNAISCHKGLTYFHEMVGPMPTTDNSLLFSQDSLYHQRQLAGALNLTPGETIRIKEAVAIEGTARAASALGFYVKGESKTKKVSTGCGHGIEGTPEHRIKVLDSKGEVVWRHLGDIQVGDRVCIHRSANLFPNQELYTQPYYQKSLNSKDFKAPEFLNEQWGYLIGLLVANGSWTLKQTVEATFHTDDKENYVKSFEACGLTETFFDIDPRSSFSGSLKLHRVDAREFLDKLGWTINSTPSTKLTPWAIRRSPKHVVAAYLSGLFDGDGSVESNGKSITFSTASKQLSVETQLLLLNFGIVCHRKEKTINGKPYYLIRLRGQRSVRAFMQEIGFKLSRKQQVVQQNLAKASRDGGDTEKIPNQIEWLKRLRDCLPTNTGRQPGSRKGRWGESLSADVLTQPKLRNLREEFRAIVGNAIKFGSGEEFSGYRLQALLDFARQHCQADLDAIQHFEYLQDCDYFYDTVESVEDSYAFCVDLSVPGQEQYVSQGFTNHNTLSAAVLGAYEFIYLILLGNPQEYFGIAKSTPISILTVATTADQGIRTIFGNLTAVLRACPITKALEDSGKLFIGKTEVTYPEKNLAIYSGNSKSGGQVGGTVKCFILEEAARFADAEGVNNAEQLWSNLGLATTTFKEEALKIAISSAWEQGDAIQTLVANTQGKPNALGLTLRSWDLNPIHAARDNPVVADEYIDRPLRAALEFEGIRPTIQDAFFESDIITPAFCGESAISVREGTAVDPVSSKEFCTLELYEVQRARFKSVAHLDPSVKTDSYAAAIGHSEFSRTGEQTVHIDALLVWEPKDGKHVLMSDVQSVLLDYHQFRPLRKVTADHYAAAFEALQNLSFKGIVTDTVYFANAQQMAMYSLVRSLMKERRLILPQDSQWTSLLLREFTRLKLIRNSKVDHPAGPSESKDLADAVAGVCWTLVNEAAQDKSFYPSFFAQKAAPGVGAIHPNPALGIIDPRVMPPPTPRAALKKAFQKSRYFGRR